jgi:hypothetical protein
MSVDNPIGLITSNLIASLHNKNIEIDGINVPNYAEGQRLKYNSQGKSIYTEVAGPWPENLNDDGQEKHVSLHYVIECHINGINDDTGAAITERCSNVGADLVALIMADNTRGGNALITRIDGFPYYYMLSNGETSEFVYRIDVQVERFLDIVNFHN